MTRNSISLNTARQLWAQCGGFCQNPNCSRPLFAHIGEDVVSLANVAHIIGSGANGPRSEHELASIIEKDGIQNLIMLCLDCHKIIDELELSYSVEDIQEWKKQHATKISDLFCIPRITEEDVLLREVNALLDANATIFREYGPFSNIVISGESGDGLLIWRRRCLDTILPNNQRIIQLFERNKRYFPYPWDLYRSMLNFKMHIDAFQDNCLLNRKVNDYKQFPLEFDYEVKTKLGIAMPPLLQSKEEDLEYRSTQIQTFIDRFLSNHEYIDRLQKLNISTMTVDLHDGRSLKVFVTNTYCFTEYTFDKVMAIDPAIDAIICSNPAGTYSNSVKALCIENKIGLFMLGEFMGAIRKQDDDYLNYLLKSERETRIDSTKRIIKELKPCNGIKIYLFGSYLRKKIYADIDLMLIYSDITGKTAIHSLESTLRTKFEQSGENLDITISSSSEFLSLKFNHDNRTQIYP